MRNTQEVRELSQEKETVLSKKGLVTADQLVTGLCPL